MHKYISKSVPYSVLAVLSLSLFCPISRAGGVEKEDFPQAHYRTFNKKGPTFLVADKLSQELTFTDATTHYALFEIPSLPTCKKRDMLSVQLKEHKDYQYCVSPADWNSLTLSYQKLTVKDQAFTTPIARAQLKEMTELGLYSRAGAGIRLRGPFLPSETDPKAFSTISKSTTLKDSEGMFRIEHRPPCDAAAEHTIQLQTQYKTKPLRFNKEFYCIQQALLYSFSTNQELWINAYQTALEASKKAIRDRAEMERQKHLAKLDPSDVLDEERVSEGTYISCQHYVGVRGRFIPRYIEGKRVGFDKAEDQYRCGATVFIVPDAEPCEPSTEYTIRFKGEDGYFCTAKDQLAGLTRPTKELLTLSDAVHCSEDTLQRVSAVYKKQELAENKKLEDLGAVGKPIASIDVFEHLRFESGPPLKVFKTDIADCPECYLVRYFGPLYGACGGYCKVQGYTVLMDREGTVVRFLQSSLIIYKQAGRSELVIPEDGLQKIVDFVNQKKSAAQAGRIGLTEFFEKLQADKILAASTDYAARWSKETQLWGAGNTVGTFVLHMGFVRQKLKLGDWPQYDWKSAPNK